MKLTDLNPRRFTTAGAEVTGSKIDVGITFDCPCCVGTDRAMRLAVHVSPPWDPLHQVDAWLQGNASLLYPNDRKVWGRAGDDWDSLTLTPSIDASQHGHWHGFITNGEIN